MTVAVMLAGAVAEADRVPKPVTYRMLFTDGGSSVFSVAADAFNVHATCSAIRSGALRGAEFRMSDGSLVIVRRR